MNMKNKIVYIIISILFIISISLCAICIKKIYVQNILPINEKIAIYEKLERKEAKIDKKLNAEINTSKNKTPIKLLNPTIQFKQYLILLIGKFLLNFKFKY